MLRHVLDPSSHTLEDYVESFESALADRRPVELADYLPAEGHPLRDLVLSEILRIDLEHGWANGSPRPLSEYRERFPAFFADPDKAGPVTFEEYRQRRCAGQNPHPEDYRRDFGVRIDAWPPAYPEDSVSMREAAVSYRSFREAAADNGEAGIDNWLRSFPGSTAHARLFHDLHRSDPAAAGRLASGLTALPEVGTEFLGFRLVAELGRGAFGRVFLAEQPALANRKVALKVAPDVGGESHTLAQLQHTHIVPIYSVHRSGALQAVCMPFFGSLTLADVLRDLSARPTMPLSGTDLLSSLAARSSTPPSPSGPPATEMAPVVPPHSIPPTILKRLEGRSYVEAVLWFGSCLADGLAHAHERGIVHRDLKPANVLLTDEGQPMLLDFNLSEDTKLQRAEAAVVGGTLPYMAPEHLAAFDTGEGSPDARSDIFALGILLHELLTGRHPFVVLPQRGGQDLSTIVRDMLTERRQAPALANRWNRAVSPAVASILLRCLEPDPPRRYQSARHLQEDLERQLEYLPLKHAPDPSIRERVRKHFRRSPRLLAKIIAGVALVLVVAAMIFGVRANQQRRVEEVARVRLEQVSSAEDAQARMRKEMMEVQFLLNTHQEKAERERGIALCREILDRYSVLASGDWKSGPLVEPLDPDRRARLMEDVGELLLLLARTELRVGRFVEALEYNHKAGECFTDETLPAALWMQRAEIRDRTGDRTEADRLKQQARSTPPRTARDLHLIAREHVLSAHYREAVPLLQRATTLDPESFWAWFLLGLCHDGLGNDPAAYTCYNTCVALGKDFPGGYFNRGLTHFRQKNYPAAEADFEVALRLRPGFVHAHINRALALQGMRKYKEAVDDLTKAMELDGSMTRLHFMRSLARRRAGDTVGADRDFEEGLKRQPNDEHGWNARGNARMGKGDHEGALADYNEGLKLNPRFRPLLNSKAHLLAEKMNRQAEAVTVLDEVLRLYPDYLPARSGRGVVLARLGERDKAHADARETRLRSDAPDITYQIGCIYALTSKGKPEDAATAFARLFEALDSGFGSDLIEIDPDLKPLHTHPDFAKVRALAREREARKRANR